MPDDSPTDSAARQADHADKIKLEHQLMRESGKSLGAVRKQLRDEEGERRARAYLALLNKPPPPRESVRPAVPALAVTTVELPKKQIVPNQTITAGSVGDPPASNFVKVRICDMSVADMPTRRYAYLLERP